MSLHQSVSPGLNLAVELRRAVAKSRVELSTTFSRVLERSGGGVDVSSFSSSCMRVACARLRQHNPAHCQPIVDTPGHGTGQPVVADPWSYVLY